MRASIWTSGSKPSSAIAPRAEIVPRIVFRRTASAELRAIARTTKAKWGDRQARLYVAELRDRINSLCEFPLRFPEFGPERPGLRKMRCGSHAVFYRIDGEQIEIVRILHESMDFATRL